MSRSNAPKQATLNKWVNFEAVSVYAAGLDEQARQIEGKRWPDEPSVKQAKAAAALKAAGEAMRAALELAAEAERRASDVAYEFYVWDWAIIDAGGVADRFPTLAEAAEALGEGGYPAGSHIKYAPAPKQRAS